MIKVRSHCGLWMRFHKLIKESNNEELIDVVKQLLPEIKKDSKERRKEEKKERLKKYYDYLGSPEWRNKRQEVFNSRSKCCERCKRVDNLEIHHKTYKNIYKEKLEDLQILCRSCHKSEHSKRK